MTVSTVPSARDRAQPAQRMFRLFELPDDASVAEVLEAFDAEILVSDCGGHAVVACDGKPITQMPLGATTPAQLLEYRDRSALGVILRDRSALDGMSPGARAMLRAAMLRAVDAAEHGIAEAHNDGHD